MLRAVIFDFDGVITDSEILHLRAFNGVLVQYGIEITKKNYYKEYLGLTDIDCFNLVVERNRSKLDSQRIEDLVKQKNQIFEELAKNEGQIIEGVRDFLQMLRENNIPMAICSGAVLTEIELILEQSRLRNLFTIVVSAEQVRRGKPHPDGFLLTLKRLNYNIQSPILANQCIVVEDSHWGLEAARAAGMHTIAVTNSYDSEQLSLAERIVNQLSELSMNDLQGLCI